MRRRGWRGFISKRRFGLRRSLAGGVGSRRRMKRSYSDDRGEEERDRERKMRQTRQGCCRGKSIAAVIIATRPGWESRARVDEESATRCLRSCLVVESESHHRANNNTLPCRTKHIQHAHNHPCILHSALAARAHAQLGPRGKKGWGAEGNRHAQTQ